MGKPKGFFAKEVDEATARRIAYIIGENSAYGRALAEADVRRQSGEDVALVKAGATVLVVPRSDITNVVQQRESGNAAMMLTVKELEAAMERHAPEGYDPASDDMTIPFAIKLAEQDTKIERLRAALDRIVKLLR